MTLQQRIVRQFKRPEGSAGRIAGWVMAHRPSNKMRNSWTVDLLDLQAESRVLEIGYGPGLAIQRAAQIATRGEIVGIDHSRVMRDQASSRNHDAVRNGRVRLLVGSAEDALAVGDGFDAIYSVNVAMFWKEPREVFERLHNALVPGGILATSYQPRHRNARAEDAEAMAARLVTWMAEAGFEEVEVKRLELRPIPAICVLGRRTNPQLS